MYLCGYGIAKSGNRNQDTVSWTVYSRRTFIPSNDTFLIRASFLDHVHSTILCNPKRWKRKWRRRPLGLKACRSRSMHFARVPLCCWFIRWHGVFHSFSHWTSGCGTSCANIPCPLQQDQRGPLSCIKHACVKVNAFWIVLIRRCSPLSFEMGKGLTALWISMLISATETETLTALPRLFSILKLRCEMEVLFPMVLPHCSLILWCNQCSAED